MSSLYKIGESAKSFSSRTELNECEDVRKSFGCFMTQLIKKKIFRNTSLKQLITPFLMICLLSLETGNFYK